MTVAVPPAPAVDCEIDANPDTESSANPPADKAPPPQPLTLRRLFAANKRRMLFTYALFNAENVLRLAQPLVLGLAINGLLKGSYAGLALFVVQHLAHLGISTLRRMYDTRAFNTIYTELATGLVTEQRGRSVDVSRVSARSALSRGYVEFFEEHVPLMIRAGYSVVGALLLLGWYDWMLVPFCAVLVLPAVLLNAAYGRKTLTLSKQLHDRFELEVGVIGRGDAGEVRRHYDDVAESRVRLSDAEAVNFGLMELFILGLMVAALIHFCAGGTVQAGDIFAVFRYVMMFIMGLDAVPKLVHQVSRLRDIGFRLRVTGGN
ncbi:MAG: ABC transporter six-transmembrane domain-containing protein [Planctomycetaceae bacterium]